MQCQRPCIPRLPPSGPQRIYKWPSLDPYPILLNAFQAHSTLLHPTQSQSLQLNPIHSQPTLLTPTRSYPIPLSPTLSSNILINPAQPCPSLPHTTLSCPILFNPIQSYSILPILCNPTQPYSIRRTPTHTTPRGWMLQGLGPVGFEPVYLYLCICIQKQTKKRAWLLSYGRGYGATGTKYAHNIIDTVCIYKWCAYICRH